MALFFAFEMAQFRLVESMLLGMYASSRIARTKEFIQHGTTTVFAHCRNVAFVSLKIARVFHIKVDSKSLVRGALLHDYFLYDWHDKKARPSLHGFKHPYIALKNAKEDYELNPTEIDIISRHMFPLTVLPPKTKEGWIVSIADKLCSLYETFKLNERHIKKRKKLIAKTFQKRISLQI